jgi:hypothetical protein
MSTIVPIQIPTNIVRFDVKLIKLELFSKAEFFVNSYDEDNKLIKTDIISLTPQEYQQWNSDDSFIVNLVAERLGYVIKNV